MIPDTKLSMIFAMTGLLGLLYWQKRNVKRSPNAEKYKLHFMEAERRYGIPRGLLYKMAEVESGFNPALISNKGAVGIMQIIPKWHPGVDPTDPITSIYYAGKYMRKLFNRFGSWRQALAAYNWGPTNLSEKGANAMPLETRNYIAKITKVIPV